MLLSVCLSVCVCPKFHPLPASPILRLLTQFLAGITVIAQEYSIQSDREFDLKGQGQRPYACLRTLLEGELRQFCVY